MKGLKKDTSSVQNSLELPKLLARGQKRLKYWRETLTKKTLTPSQMEDAQASFDTYSLLLSKITRAQSDVEKQETLERITSIERKLASFFELARLATNTRTATQLPSTSKMPQNDDH